MAKDRKFPAASGNNSTQDDSGRRRTHGNNSAIFIEGYLTDADKRWLSDNVGEQAELVFDFVFNIPQFLRFAVKYEEKSGRYLATLTRTDSGHSDCGKVLCSRGATPLDAAYALYYRHVHKFAAGWGEADNTQTERWG